MNNQISPNVFNKNTKIVRVKLLSSVVRITVLEVSVPSCPIDFAMTKLLTVVALPSITRIAMSLSFLNPSATAIGRKIAAKPINLKKAAMIDGNS